jgi:crotonobetainyl-CoA:carnitine CoA-transferase CaiB-like acyl-CoA transferase
VSAPTELPLKGITVIDCGHVVSAPMIATLLGDFGAEVIKVENPQGGDQLRFFGRHKNGIPLHWQHMGRNKNSITLTLSKPAGQELLLRLVEATQADVVIESFRPGTMEKWNLSDDRLRHASKGVCVVHVSGFGQTGPYRDRPGFGTLAEAMSGFAHVTGPANGPPTLPPFPLADSVAALYAAFGVMIALYYRDARDGAIGQSLDVSLLEPLFSLLAPHLVEYDQLGVIATRSGNRTGSAPRNTYLTKDKRWIAISASTQTIASRLFNVMGRPDMIDDPRFSTNPLRVANADELDPIVGEWIGRFTQTEAIDILIKAEVAVAPILDISDLAVDPQLAHRNAITSVNDPELGPVRMPNVLPKLSDTPGSIRTGAPRLGQHNWDIYHGKLGLSQTEIDDLHGQGVI